MESTETVVDASVGNAATAARRAVSARSDVWRRRVRSPLAVAGCVFLLYGLILGVFAAMGHDPRDLEALGQRFVTQGGNASSVISLDPAYTYPSGEIGYDGQFYTFIALDPLHAVPYLDDPAGRMSRIVYPLTARLLAAGQPALIPWTLILVNLLACAGGTWLVAKWLSRRGITPWWALVYGLSAGLCIGLLHDLTEPLAYMLAMAGLLVLDTPTSSGDGNESGIGWRRLLAAGALFALAGLTRETSLVFAVAVALAWWLRGRQPGNAQLDEASGAAHGGWWRWLYSTRWREAGALAALAGAPYLIWKLVLHVLLGPGGVPDNWLPAPYPFAGLISLWPWNVAQQVAVLVVAVPALLVAALGVTLLRARGRRVTEVAVWALVINLLWLVVFLPRDSWADFVAASRLSDGVVLAAVLCVPLWTRRQRAWFLFPGLVWCLLTPFLLAGLLGLFGPS